MLMWPVIRLSKRERERKKENPENFLFSKLVPQKKSLVRTLKYLFLANNLLTSKATVLAGRALSERFMEGRA